ncbi:hypothetical protein O181_050878 [Austropuccinia psidii MF-1]|uniref:Uncharacterized protein n=1 Tax=Austropuccinia psidii MF-1 TaxID=1389203 RepID=A0A9Q3HMS9_9BASI|nr:hypothetical protein [Austropuccinia psidii MF-1]
MPPKKPTKNAVPLKLQKIPWINVEGDKIDNEPPHTEFPPILNEKIHDETPPVSPLNNKAFQERETIKNDTMGQDRTDIRPDHEPKVSSSANVQGIFLGGWQTHISPYVLLPIYGKNT